MMPNIDRVFTIQGIIRAADILGSGVGQLNNAGGVLLVPSSDPSVVTSFLSATIVNEFDTAAYAINTNAHLWMLQGSQQVGVSLADAFISAAARSVMEMHAVDYVHDNPDTGLYLALDNPVFNPITNPGSAQGVFRYIVRYRRLSIGG